MEEFIYLCRMFGGLNELVQYGGGNISIKNKNELIIKSSGFALADINKENGFVILDLEKIKQIDFTSDIEPNLKNFILKNNNPSIETYFHIFLKKYVVHLHPTLINMELCKYKPNIKINNDFLLIEYIKPGYDLAKEIYKKYNNEQIIFLKNHGVIFTTDTLDDMKHLISNTFNSFKKTEDFINIKKYIELYDKICKNNEILFKVSHEYSKYIPSLTTIKSYTPDIIVYLGSTINDTNSILYIFDNNIFIKSDNKYKCYKIFEVLESYFYLDINKSNAIHKQEIYSIQNWEKEIFRQNLK